MEKATRVRLNKIRLIHHLYFAKLRLFAGKKVPLKSSVLFHYPCVLVCPGIYKKGIKFRDCEVHLKIQNLNEIRNSWDALDQCWCFMFGFSIIIKARLKTMGRHVNVMTFRAEVPVFSDSFPQRFEAVWATFSLSCIVLISEEAGGKKSDILILDFMQCLCIERRPVWRNEFLSHVVGSVLVADKHCRSQVFLSNRQFILSGFFIWMNMNLKYTELTSMLIIEVFVDVCVVVLFIAQYFKTEFQIK